MCPIHKETSLQPHKVSLKNLPLPRARDTAPTPWKWGMVCRKMSLWIAWNRIFSYSSRLLATHHQRIRCDTILRTFNVHKVLQRHTTSYDIALHRVVVSCVKLWTSLYHCCVYAECSSSTKYNINFIFIIKLRSNSHESRFIALLRWALNWFRLQYSASTRLLSGWGPHI